MSNEILFEHDAQICGMYPIHAIGDAESPPDWVETFVEGYEFETVAKHFPDLAELLERQDLSTKELASEIAERWIMRRHSGFIVHGQVNVRTYAEGGKSFFSGPGYQQIHWFYVATADEAVTELIQRAEAQHAKSRAKAGAA